MDSALTLVNIYEDDVKKVGYRAVDLARIAQAKHSVPLSFVIPCQVFDEFLSQSGIAIRLPGIYSSYTRTHEGYSKAYADITHLFDKVNFSASLAESLIESYESLAIPNESSGASGFVRGVENPPVTLLISPTYIQSPEGLTGFLQNIFGQKEFLLAIKEAWLSLFLPQLVLERHTHNITEFSAAIIVQQQLRGDSAESSFRSQLEAPIQVKGYFGLFDKAGLVAKDEHSLSVEHLRVLKSLVRQQAYKLVPSETSGELLESYLQEKGSEQKLSDKQVLEVGRLTKRIHILLGANIKLHFRSKGEDVSVLHVFRMVETQVVERELAVAQSVDAIDEVYDESFEEEQSSEDLESFEEIEAHEHPVEIIETEAVAVEVLDKVDEFVEKLEQQEEDNTLFPLLDDEPPLQESPSVDEPQSPLFADEENVFPHTQELYTMPKEEKEETLFDLFTEGEQEPQLQVPESQMEESSSELLEFVRGVVQDYLSFLEHSYHEYYQQKSESFEELIDDLESVGMLSFPKEDILFIKEVVENGDEPEDHVVGLAFRISSFLKKKR